jgi:uncharacterized protein YkwD
LEGTNVIFRAGNSNRIGAAATVIVAALLWAFAVSDAPSAGAADTAGVAEAKSCPFATATATTATKAQLRKGVSCLIAHKRKGANVHRVAPNPLVKSVSQQHARTMVKTDCFKHVCEGEASIPTRLKQSGYLDGARTYGFGENTGCAATPKAMVAAWMHSDYHRGNLLGRKFRDLGVGVAKGAPPSQSACQGKGFTTFSVLFTWRKG